MTTATSRAPLFRADHVGSLLRPAQIKEARALRNAGRITDAQLRLAEDEGIRRVVALQEGLGLGSATDGEFRRSAWQWDFFAALGGVREVAGEVVASPFRNERGPVARTHPVYRVTGKLRLEQPVFAADFTFLKNTVTTAVPKLTIPSPNTFHRYGGAPFYEPSAYADPEAFRADLVTVYRREIAELSALGCTYLQLDDVSFTQFCDPEARAKLGITDAGPHRSHIALLNDALAGRPAGMTVATHTCRGNHRSGWLNSGAYDFIAEQYFAELAVDAFFLEYDDERSGDFAPLRFVPKGKRVMLGLVTTKRGALESKDALKRRIEQAAKVLPLEQLGLSTQCGFASTLDGNELTVDEEVAKLRLIVETAAEVWGGA